MTAGEGSAGGVGSGAVVVDLRVLQSPDSRATLPVKLAFELAQALERNHPDLVGGYLLAPDWPPPSDLGDLIATGKVAYSGTAGAIGADARVYLSLFCWDLGLETAKLWPATVESEGLLFCAVVHSLDLEVRPAGSGSEEARGFGSESSRGGGGSAVEAKLRRAASVETLRQADTVLVTSDRTATDLATIGVDPARITVLPPALLEGALATFATTAAPLTGRRAGSPSMGLDSAAGHAATVLEQIAPRRRRPWRRPPQRRRRMALVSPFPPIPSGVAEYSSKLVRALWAELNVREPQAELDCFADGRDRASAAPDMTIGPLFDARSFGGIEAARSGYDQVVFVLGNSQYHAGALTALRQGGRRGIVMAHDVRMTNLLRYSPGVPGHTIGGLEDAIKRSYGSLLPEGLGRNNEVSAEEEEAYGLLLLRDVAIHASSVLVSSPAALRLAEVDLGPALSDRLAVMPFAIELQPAELSAVDTAAAGRRTSGRFRITSFGIVDPIKRLDIVVGAVAEMLNARADVELYFVGPVSDSVSASVRRLAVELGISERVHLTGVLERERYLEQLGQAHVAVQLRARDGGEASAAVGDCLAAGLPTVVSRIGWLGDLPDDVAVKIPRLAGAPLLAEVLTTLLGEEEVRASLSRHAAAWAARQTFERAAQVLLDATGVGPR